jgi:predicted membrane protein
METEIKAKENCDDIYKNWEKNRKRGKLIGGLLIVAAGSLYLAKEMGVILPAWIFSWQMLLIALGVFIAVKHACKRFSWFVFVTIGTLFLLRDYYAQFDFTNYILPVLVILAGLTIMFRPRRNCRNKNEHWKKWQHCNNEHRQWKHSIQNDKFPNTNDYIELDSVFASLKKNIISKDFKGGEVNCVFGGAEINLTQADITEKAELEINCVFAGVRLIIPAHWEIKSDISAVLGNVEDKREVRKDLATEGSKILVLKGSTVFGGIEILNY